MPIKTRSLITYKKFVIAVKCGRLLAMTSSVPILGPTTIYYAVVYLCIGEQRSKGSVSCGYTAEVLSGCASMLTRRRLTSLLDARFDDGRRLRAKLANAYREYP
jgi:hypothetical protein